jgi:hypothetical protein
MSRNNSSSLRTESKAVLAAHWRCLESDILTKLPAGPVVGSVPAAVAFGAKPRSLPR